MLVVPEYNHGYLGELKILIDSAYQEYKGKPIGICGVSSGALGGARVIEQMRQVVVGVRAIPAANAAYFSFIEQLFDENGKLTEGKFLKLTDELVDEVVSYLV